MDLDFWNFNSNFSTIKKLWPNTDIVYLRKITY